MEGTNLGAVFASIKLDTSGLTLGVERSKRLLQQMGQQMTFQTSRNNEALRSNLNGIGNLAAMVTASFVGSMGLAIRETANFEKAMRNVNSISGMSEEQFSKVSEAVKRMATEVGKAPEDLANGLYDIASAGHTGADGLQILEAAAKASKAGLSTTAEAAKAILVALNAYGMQASEAGRVSDVLFKAVDVGIFTFSELANSMGMAVASAAAAKVPLEDVMAAMASITKAGFSPDESATAIGRMVTAFLNPSKELAKAIKNAGIESGATLLQMKGLAGAAEFLQKASGGSAEYLAKMGMDARALRAALVLTKDGARVFISDQEAMQSASGATAKALKEQSKSMAQAWEKAIAAIKDAQIGLGEAFAPAIKASAEAVTSMAKSFAALSPQTKQTAAGVITVAAAFTAMIAVVSKVAGVILSFQANIALAGTSVGAMTAAIGPWVGVIAVATAAVFGLYKAFQYLNRDTTAETKAAAQNAQAKATQVQATQKLVTEYEKLHAKTKPTADQQQRMRTILGQIAQTNPELIKGYDAQLRPLGLVNGAVQSLAKSYDRAYAAAVRLSRIALVTERQSLFKKEAQLNTQIQQSHKVASTGKMPPPPRTVYGPGGMPSIEFEREATPEERSAAAKRRDEAEGQRDAIAERRQGVEHNLRVISKLGILPEDYHPKTAGGKKKKPKKDTTQDPETPGKTPPAPATPAAPAKKTASERSDEAARSAMDFFDYEIAFGKATPPDKAAGIERVLAGRGQKGSPYAALSRSTATQMQNELKSIRQQEEESEKRHAQSLKQIREAADQESSEKARADFDAAQDYKIRTMEATAKTLGQKLAALDARYGEDVRKLAESGGNTPEALAALTADWQKARQDARDADSTAARQTEQRLLDWQLQHYKINTDQYVAALDEQLKAVERNSDEERQIISKKEDAYKDQADEIADRAEQIAIEDREGALQMLRVRLEAYKAMGDAGVGAANRIQEAIDTITGKKSRDTAESIKQSWQHVVDSLREGFVGALADWIQGVNNFRDFFKQAVGQILRCAINSLVQMALKGKGVFAGLKLDVSDSFRAMTASITKDLGQIAAQAMGVASLFGHSGKRRTGGILGGIVGGLLAPAFTLGNFLTGAGIGSVLLGGGFDNPLNDTGAVRSGADYARLFRTGALSEMGAAFPASPQVSSGPDRVTNNATSNTVNISMQVDKLSSQPQDLERIADGLAWMINKRIRVAPAG